MARFIKVENTVVNADLYYHMLSSYIAEHDKFGVVESLGEIS